MWNGAAETLKARPASRNTRPNEQADARRRRPARRVAMSVKSSSRRSRRSARRRRAACPRTARPGRNTSGRLRSSAASSRSKRGQHVERQGLQLEADIERDQVVGRDHHPHAERGEQDQHREFEARDLLLVRSSRSPCRIATRRADSISDLHEAAKASTTNAPSKAERAGRRRPSTTAAAAISSARRQASEISRSTRRRERAEQQQHQRADRQDSSGRPAARSVGEKRHRAASAPDTARLGGGARAGSRQRSGALDQVGPTGRVGHVEERAG